MLRLLYLFLLSVAAASAQPTVSLSVLTAPPAENVVLDQTESGIAGVTARYNNEGDQRTVVQTFIWTGNTELKGLGLLLDPDQNNIGGKRFVRAQSYYLDIQELDNAAAPRRVLTNGTIATIPFQLTTSLVQASKYLYLEFNPPIPLQMGHSYGFNFRPGAVSSGNVVSVWQAANSISGGWGGQTGSASLIPDGSAYTNSNLQMAFFMVSTPIVRPPTGAMVKRVIEGPSGAYFTYTHANGFLPGGRAIVLARPLSGQQTEFISFDLATGATESLGTLDKIKMYYAVSRDGMMVTNSDNSLVVMDLKEGVGSLRTLWQSQAPWRLSDLPDFSPDGRKVLIDFHDYGSPERHQIREFAVDAPTGQGTMLVEKSWLLNHVHYSPFSPDWISFAHEGSPVSDRMWAWHPQLAPQGKNIFDQKIGGRSLGSVGHEVALRNKASVLVVAYGTGQNATPTRGLYEVKLTGAGQSQSVQLISEGNRDLHCNVSCNGLWAVVDTMGRSDDNTRIPSNWLDYGNFSDVVAVNIRSGERQFLDRGTILPDHPWHPHPHISPDCRWVIYNDASTRRVRILEIDPEELRAFLGD